MAFRPGELVVLSDSLYAGVNPGHFREKMLGIVISVRRPTFKDIRAGLAPDLLGQLVYVLWERGEVRYEQGKTLSSAT